MRIDASYILSQRPEGEKLKRSLNQNNIAGSSNGRTPDFGSGYLGPNPSPAALQQAQRKL